MAFEVIDFDVLSAKNTRHNIVNQLDVKYLIVTRLNVDQEHLLSLMTVDGKIVFYSMSFSSKTHHISSDIYNKIVRFTKNFNFTKDSVVIFLDNIDKYNPLKMYLYIIRPFLKFRIENVPIGQMIKRLFTFRKSWMHTTNNSRKLTFNDSTCTRYLNIAWEKLVESKECPWIDSNIDMMVRLKSLKAGLRIKIQRLVMFYAIVRLYYINIRK